MWSTRTITGTTFFGNQAFKEAQFIGHQNLSLRMRQQVQTEGHPAPWLKNMLPSLQNRRSKMDPASPEAQFIDAQISTTERIYDELAQGFEVIVPFITFSDKLSLDLGDMTLNLYYYGQADTDNSIVAHIPELGLAVVGDIYSTVGIFSDFDDGLNLDIPRWIEVLNAILNDENGIKHVVFGHQKIAGSGALEFRRQYIVDLWECVKEAKEQGLTLAETKKRLSLDSRFSYLKDFFTEEIHANEQHGTEGATPLGRSHIYNIAVFWRQLQKSAAGPLMEALSESGSESVLKAYKKMKSDGRDVYYFDEGELNRAGYRLLREGKTEAAILLFKINVEMFPQSFNVYDSLGEAYMANGQKELAIANYKKSLELNPNNQNAVEMLKRLQKRK